MFGDEARAYISRKKGVAGIIALLSVCYFAFHMYTGYFGSFDAYIQRAVHLLMGLLLIYFGGLQKAKNRWEKAVNITAVIAVALSVGYIFARFEWVTVERFAMVTPLSLTEKILGLLLVFLVMEAARRVVGSSLVCVVGVFLAYPFIGPYLPGVLQTKTIAWTDILDQLYLTTEGIFGMTLGVSATVLALFIIFGAFIASTGAGNMIFELSAAAVGRSKGGPAKIAVLASGLMGSINGAPTANVATIGALTIPMMKKLGYKPSFAGGVEACASTGGQFLPPVMGAIAFVMVAFTGIPYVQIMKYALIPALLFYLSIYITVHLEALRLNLPSMSGDKTVRQVMGDYWHMLIPVAVLVVMLIRGYSPSMSGAVATAFLAVVSFFKASTRPSFSVLMEAFEAGARSSLVVVTSTAVAGIVIGIIDFTGIGDRLAASLVALGGEHFFLVLVLVAVVSIILGMGMPPVPAYVMQVGLTIPALVDLGVPLYVAHLFVFYFSGLAVITPPIAVAAYAAGGLAEASPMKTGWEAFRIAMPSFIIPFMFVLNPALLLEGKAVSVILVTATAIIGVFSLSVCMVGYLKQFLGWYERVLAFSAAILLILPLNVTIIPGIAILAAVIFIQFIKKARQSGGLAQSGQPYK